MSDHLRPPTPSFLGKIKGKNQGRVPSIGQEEDKTDAPEPDAAKPKPSSNRRDEDKTDTSVPDAAQSKASSNKQEEDKTDAPDAAQSNPTDSDSQTIGLEPGAIAKLKEWKTNNRNTKGRKLAKKIHDFLEWEVVTAAQDFIPDSPFPAKTLVKFLLTIIDLGPRVADIQEQTYDFAAEAIESLSTLVTAANEEPDVQKYLEAVRCALIIFYFLHGYQHMYRGVVNEICVWASKHVGEIHLSPDGVKEWRTKLEKAIKNFETTTRIEEQVNQARDRRKNSIKEKLTNHIAANHKHTDQKKSLCAENTRGDIQKQIMKWLSSQDPTDERIFWITGIAGSGKSTLSATIVDNLRKRKTPVAAQFFISRNIPETVDPTKLVPTIALQLAEFSPAAAHKIEAALKDGFPGSQEEQVKELLLAPIRVICKSYDRAVILIDALDELQDAAVSVPKILSLLAPKSKDSDLPAKLRFIVTSRPEYWADIARSKSLNPTMFQQEELATDKVEVHDFIVARFQEIKKEIDLEGPQWNDWPSDSQVSKLSTATDGLFHYAATALKWIQGEIERDGEASQEQVFEKFSKLGIGELKQLYRVILTSFENIDVSTEDTVQRGNRLHGFQHVIGTILVLYKPMTFGQIITLSPQRSFDVRNFLQRSFRSVLIPGTTTSFEEATPQMHKSFRDYIMGEQAPEQFHIHMSHAHFVTAKNCLEVIVRGDSQSDAVLKYSKRHWYKHLREAVEGEATFQDEGIWDLLGGMEKEEVVGGWKGKAFDVFIDVGTVGWRLLERGTDAARVEKISNILIKAKEVRALVFLCCRFLPRSLLLTHLPSSSCLQKLVRAATLSPVLASLTSRPLLASSCRCLVRAAPLLLVLASLTSRPLLACRRECLVRAAPLLPVLASLTSCPLLASSWRCEVRAAPLLLVLAPLTSHPLLASRGVECLVRATPLLPVLALLTSCPLLASREFGVCRSSVEVRAAPLSLEVCAAPLSLVLASLTSRPLLASSGWCLVRAAPLSLEVRAAPLSPVLASLTSCPLLASRGGCRSSVAGPCLTDFPSSSCLQEEVCAEVRAAPLSPEVRAAPMSPTLAPLTSRPLLACRRRCLVRAAPLSPVLALLTSCPVLASREECLVRAAPLSPVLASLTSRPPLASRECFVRAAPLSPVLASLTSCPLLASKSACPSYVAGPCLADFPVLFLPPEIGACCSSVAESACRSSVAGPCLADFPSSSCLQELVRAAPLSPEVRAAPLSPVLSSLTSCPPLASRRECFVRAAPLSPVLASLTSCPLLASRERYRVHAAPLLPVLASLTSCPLLASKSACRSSVAASSSCLQEEVRAAPLSPEVCAAPLSPGLASLTSRPLLASSWRCLVRAAPLSPVLALLTSCPVLASRERCEVRAAPLSPILVLLTSCPLLACRSWCEVRAAPLSLVLALLTSCPLPASSLRCLVCAAPLSPVLASLTSRPLLASIGACRSSVAGPGLTDFLSSSCL
ncbi:hypothetical protein MSAN_00153800 [Mycena sanguinolenta]|uniref:NACHT domain-containing protein n=1 Tax=Mycena sanguinolenta TaxID=230812 RepID=A0A8H6ZHA0_9AGAR|nr:hypothetical protein MSAN_00153800 [Mycena sanguinolenta]